MLTIACVNVQNYLGRGEEYVNKLRAQVSRHLSQPFEFVCIRESNKAGWWSKIDMFLPGRFSGRVLYIDLDSVIVGSLDKLVQTKGIIHLNRWGWHTLVYGSGVMVWDAGEHAEIYEQFTDAVPQRLRGDQDWMTELGGWEALPDGVVCSYRYHAVKAPPPGVSIVAFHGQPKPSDLPPDHWAHRHWRE